MTELNTSKAFKEFSLWSFDKNEMQVMAKKHMEVNSFSYISYTEKKIPSEIEFWRNEESITSQSS